MQDIVTLDSRRLAVRIVLGVAILLVVILGWWAIKWQLGNMLATLLRPSDPNAVELSDLALTWAPGDPAASWLKASITDGIAMYEQTVRLAPNDYRWRGGLGRALEQADDLVRAEAELKKAVDLAPSYAVPRWHLGNFYLRQGRVDEAMAQLKKAAEKNQTYREQAFSLAWDYFDKDVSRVEYLAGDGPEARARLAYFFAGRGEADEALRNWNMLSESDKAGNPVLAKGMAHGLYIQRHFPQSLEFARQFGIDADARFQAVTNPSFEKALAESPDSRFNWQVVRTDAKFDASIDQRVKKDGNRSLRVSFKNYVKPELYNVFQTVAVEPGKPYRLTFWLRTENLRSAGRPMLEIVNANDDKIMASSTTFPGETTDWQQLSVEFTTPENCNGINIRTARAYCGDQCPLTGIFWYDGFELAR